MIDTWLRPPSAPIHARPATWGVANIAAPATVRAPA